MDQRPITKTIRLCLSLAAAAAVSAQVYTPPKPPSNSSGAPTDTTTVVRSTTPASKSPFGEEVPLLDPAAETITVGGVTIPLGDNRVLQARFEKYLSQPPENSEAAREYRATIDDILDELSPYRKGGPDIYEAFKLLPRASVYPGDSRICSTLAEAIYVAMLARKDNRSLKKINATLESEKHVIIGDGDWKARHDRDPEINQSSQGAGGKKNNKKQATTAGRGVQSLEYAEYLRRIAEIEALKKKNIAQTELQTLQSKIQYQANMIQWFVQRRYQHVLMASRFYNQIWKDGDSALRIDKNSDVSKMFTESLGVSPTVSTLDSLANEAIREVDKAIEAFNFLVERSELHTASRRLMEAFLIGEYLAPVATLEREKKRKVQIYVRHLHELYGVMQARDYGKAQELVSTLKQQAHDFPTAKAESAVAGYTLASDLAIEKAKTYLLSGDSDRAAEEVKAAAEIWPTNPKLDEFKDLVANSSSIVTLRNDFDRLLSEGNYRQIFKRRFELAPVIKGDPTREDAMEQILENIRRIEIALNKAAEFANMGNSYGAWEQLARLREEFPDDPNLGRELEKLAPKVADFTKALDRAQRFERRRPQQTGSAICWYLKAKRLYPDSKMAEEGFQRLLDKVLPEGDTLPPSTEAETTADYTP